jgi:hypothetical protein
MLKNPTSMKEELRGQNSRLFLPSFSCFAIGVSAGICPRALVDESEMVRTRVGTHNKLEMVAVLWMLCAIPPHNSNSNSII